MPCPLRGRAGEETCSNGEGEGGWAALFITRNQQPALHVSNKHNSSVLGNKYLGRVTPTASSIRTLNLGAH